MKLLLIFLFLSGTAFGPAVLNKGSIELIIDPEYKGAVELFDHPNGKKLKSVWQDFKNEDYLFFTATDETSDFFYGTLQYSISGRKIKGWVKKAKYIGIYARNYDARKAMKLFSDSNSNSKVNVKVTEWINQLIPVRSYKAKWVYVNFDYKGKSYVGWLPPNLQCTNPYTTCN
jgi:hypothetical protein